MELQANKLQNQIQYIQDSIKGTTKRENQDNILIIDTSSYKFFFLFDGVGGALNGRQATIIAIDFIKINFEKYFSNQNFNIKDLLLDTNKHITNSSVPDALTTIACLIILPSGKVIVANLGDTRVYCFHHSALNKISVDDKVPLRDNVITKCLGMPGLLKNDIHEFHMRKDDGNFLICTDGFYNILETSKLKFLKVLNTENIKFAPKKLANLIAKKNKDDSTYIAVYC